MKRIAITGASGFIGTNYIRNNKIYYMLEADLLLNPLDSFDFSGLDGIIHLAAYVHHMKDAKDEMYFSINRDLAFEVAKKAKMQGVKQFVFMSTAKVFGETSESDLPFNEDSKCAPEDSYGKSKLEAENLISGLDDEKFRVAIIRTPMVYGEGVKGNMLRLLKLASVNPVLPLGGIKNKRSIVYVGNLIALINRIIDLDACGIFIAGDRSPISTSDLISIMGKNLRHKLILFSLPYFFVKIICALSTSLENRLYKSFVLDNSKTNTRLDFIPPFTSEEGIHSMTQWYKSTKHK